MVLWQPLLSWIFFNESYSLKLCPIFVSSSLLCQLKSYSNRNSAIENVLTQLTFKLNYYPAVPDLVHGQRGTDLLIKISTTCEGQTEGKPELCTQTIVHLCLSKYIY